MFRVVREFQFCYGHRLLEYEGKCRFLHGHNAKALVVLEAAQLDSKGMVLDFGEVKRRLGQWIEENLDHRMILHRLDPVVPILLEAGETLFLLDVNPTAEHIAQLLWEQAQRLGLPVVEVAFWETPHCQAVFATSGGAIAPNVHQARPIHGQLIPPRNPGPVMPQPASQPPADSLSAVV
ncbi:MAG: 6-carboxytetrahydropterin synthase [Thermoguttaceae bacterium]|nr:6-carboxytetrahydropterin synthase [Thermoguttaceae bacterium]MDW8038127.1 6-carboxytetrahydropterin synthase [Thermoguttaceae bacterium]